MSCISRLVSCISRLTSHVIFLAFSTHAMAQQMTGDTTIVHDSLILRNEVVITAVRQEQRPFELPATLRTTEKSWLQQRASRSLPEVLFGTPGIFLQKTNHGGGSVFLRGLTGQQILLLTDGIRLNNATFRSGPNQYLNTLDPAWIARIEVLEGGAAEYGSDAIGGVVHAITHRLEFSEKAHLSPEATFKWQSGGMEASGQGAITASGKRWAIRTGGSYRHFGDLIGGQGIGRQSPSGYTQWAAESKLRLQLNRKTALTAAYQDLEQQAVPVFHKVQLENFKYNNFDPQRRQLGYVRLHSVFANRWWQKTEWTASRQRSVEVRKNQKNGSPVQVTERDETTTNGLQFNVVSRPLRPWSISTGVEWLSDVVRSSKTGYDESTSATKQQRGLYPDRATMQSFALYSLHTLTRRRITLNGGLRYNTFRIAIPAEGSTGKSVLHPQALVGNLGASVGLSPEIRLYAHTASAFRAPNIDDLGTLGIVDFRYEQPNYDLAPEKSRSIETGFKTQRRRLEAQWNVYYLQLRDLIGRTRTTDSLQGYAVYRKENIAGAYVWGMETHWNWSWNKNWTFMGNAAYTFGQNTTAQEPMRRIPPLYGRAGLRYHLGNNLNVQAETMFAGAQRRLAKADIEDNRIADDGTPGWKIVNFHVFYRVRGWSLAGELHNMFNEAYRTHGSGIDGTGRSVWLRLHIKL